MYLDLIVQFGLVLNDSSSVSQASFERHGTLLDNFHAIRGERNNSLSDSSYESSGLVRSVEEGVKNSSYVNNHACFWVGMAAGAIRYLLKNEDNSQLFIDFGVEALLNRMVGFDDGV